jgi:hypothetical protein
MHQQLSGYKVEEKLYVGGTRTKKVEYHWSRTLEEGAEVPMQKGDKCLNISRPATCWPNKAKQCLCRVVTRSHRKKHEVQRLVANCRSPFVSGFNYGIAFLHQPFLAGKIFRF